MKVRLFIGVRYYTEPISGTVVERLEFLAGYRIYTQLSYNAGRDFLINQKNLSRMICKIAKPAQALQAQALKAWALQEWALQA